MSEENITLVGTYHFDPRGKQRLEKLLDHLKPEMLALETSDVRLKYHFELVDETRSILEQKGLDKDLIEAYIPKITPFYEWEVCKEHSDSHSMPLHLVDVEKVYKEERERNERQFAMLKAAPLTNEKLEEGLKKFENYDKRKWLARVNDFFMYTPMVLRPQNNLLSPNMVGERDAHMCKKLLEISDSNPGKEVVHVGGVAHAVMDGKYSQNGTLYTWLPKSKVYLLKEADKL